MKTLFAILFFIIGLICYASGIVVGVGYVGIYLGVVNPIMTICEAVDADTLTGALVGKQVVMFLLRGVLTAITVIVGVFIGSLCMSISSALGDAAPTYGTRLRQYRRR